MPRTVPVMMEKFTDDWKARGVDAWNEIPNHWLPDSGERVGWWTLPEYLADRFVAPLLGAPEGTCILLPNVHWIVQCLLSSPEIAHAGSELLFTSAEFPSVRHSAKRWAHRLSMEATEVPLNDNDRLDRARILAAIRPETALVLLSHVGFTTGELLDAPFLKSVVRKAKETQTFVGVDGYHATAAVPTDVVDLGVDFYFGGLLKEACGSSGNAYLYLREGVSVDPLLTGWFGDAHPFEFRASARASVSIRRRFLGGTTAVAPLYHAVEGLRILLNEGIDRIRRDSLEKTEMCITRAQRARIPVHSPVASNRRGAVVILEVPRAETVSAALKEAGIYTDSRLGSLLRMAPYLWNTVEDIDRTFDTLIRVLDTVHSPDEVSRHGPVT